jgi:hypothetical protein
VEVEDVVGLADEEEHDDGIDILRVAGERDEIGKKADYGCAERTHDVPAVRGMDDQWPPKNNPGDYIEINHCG